MSEHSNSNGRWRTIAVALLSALLAGAGTVVVNGRYGASLDVRVTANEERIRAGEIRDQAMEAWLIRVESKLDKVIEQRGRP